MATSNTNFETLRHMTTTPTTTTTTTTTTTAMPATATATSTAMNIRIRRVIEHTYIHAHTILHTRQAGGEHTRDSLFGDKASKKTRAATENFNRHVVLQSGYAFVLPILCHEKLSRIQSSNRSINLSSNQIYRRSNQPIIYQRNQTIKQQTNS